MAVPRSKSVPAGRVSNRVDDAEETAAFPVLNPDLAHDHNIAPWARELAMARSGRHSRASSIVSTRTRFSTTTFDDARSIDIQAGNQSFHISRHGDRITDTTAPPPYSGPEDDDLFPNFGVAIPPERLRPDDVHSQQDRRKMNLNPRRVRIAMPDREETSEVNGDESPTVDTPSRVLTEEEVRQVIHDLPSQLKKALGIDSPRLEPQPQNTWEVDEAGSSSHLNVGSINDYDDAGTASNATTLHVTGSVSGRQTLNAFQAKPKSGLAHTNSTISEPEEIRYPPAGERARQLLQNLRGIRKSPPGYSQSSSTLDSGYGSGGEGKVTLHVSGEDLRPWSHLQSESSVQTTVGDLNELSQVYNRVIRDLDREHRKQLHSRDKELDQLRILLHEKDIVYRQQLKGKDFVIDDLKNRLEHFEETLEAKLERARNEVEDLWETRWKEHDRQLMAKCGLMKSPSQKYVEIGSQTTNGGRED